MRCVKRRIHFLWMFVLQHIAILNKLLLLQLVLMLFRKTMKYYTPQRFEVFYLNLLHSIFKHMISTSYFSAAASKTGTQTTLQFKPVTKKPKKNMWSDDESDGQSHSEVEAEEVVGPRERVERKTKG